VDPASQRGDAAEEGSSAGGVLTVLSKSRDDDRREETHLPSRSPHELITSAFAQTTHLSDALGPIHRSLTINHARASAQWKMGRSFARPGSLLSLSPA